MCSGVRAVTPEDEADMLANPIDAEATLTDVGAKGGFGEESYSTTARTFVHPPFLPRTPIHPSCIQLLHASVHTDSFQANLKWL